MIHDYILKLSETIDSSKKYQKIKSFFRSILEDTSYPYKKYFDYFMIFLILISVGILIASKTVQIPDWIVSFDLYFVTTIFAIEYLLRLWVSHDIHKYIVETSRRENISRSQRYILPLKSKLRYMFSLPAIIGLIAIFPKFRIIRLFKLYHYMHGTSSLFQALLKKRFEFVFLGYMLLGVTFTLGSIFYALEFGVNDGLASYLDAIYWALVTISTVGYGDISPVTDLGKIVSMFGIIFGIAMISFVTSVMVSAFSERFDELRNSDSIKHVNKMDNVVIINGYGHLGSTIAKKLKISKNYEPVIIENDDTKVQLAYEDGHRVIRADGSSAKLIKELYQQDNIAAMLTLTSSDIDNIYFILNAKSIYRDSFILSRMSQEHLRAQYRAAGVDGIVEPYKAVDNRSLQYLKSLKEEIVFFGYTHKSSHMCQELAKEGINITIYEDIEENYDRASEDGYKNVNMINFHQASYLDKIKLSDNAVVVCSMDSEAMNVYHAISLRSWGFTNEIIALSDSTEDNRKLLLAGVDKIFDMYEESAEIFVEMIKNRHNIGENS